FCLRLFWPVTFRARMIKNSFDFLFVGNVLFVSWRWEFGGVHLNRAFLGATNARGRKRDCCHERQDRESLHHNRIRPKLPVTLYIDPALVKKKFTLGGTARLSQHALIGLRGWDNGALPNAPKGRRLGRALPSRAVPGPVPAKSLLLALRTANQDPHAEHQ